MSQQHDQDLQQEQQLLEHFREHSQGEPSAAVDALILAAARQAVEPPRPSLSQRLHAWLFGAGNRTRWSMAVAGLAVFGIGLNLALHYGYQYVRNYPQLSYSDYKIGLSRAFGGITLGAAAIGTDAESRFYRYTPTTAGSTETEDVSKAAFVLSASKAF